MADDEIFGQVEFHYEIIAKRLRELSFLNNGVKIRLVDQRSGKEEDFAFLGGVKGFVEYINQFKNCSSSKRFLCDRRIRNSKRSDRNRSGNAMERHLRRTGVLCFTNNIPQSDGGTHLTACAQQ